MEWGRVGPVARLHEARLRLEEGVLDRLGPEHLGHDVGRQFQRRVDVPAADHRLGEQVSARVDPGRSVCEGGKGVRDRLQDVVLDVDERGGRACRRPRLGGDRGKDVPDVSGGLALSHEERPVERDEPLVTLAGHVAGRDDPHDPGMRCGTGDVDPPDGGPRMIGEAQRAVQHAGRRHVADEALLAEHELPPLVSWSAGTDADADRPALQPPRQARDRKATPAGAMPHRHAWRPRLPRSHR